MRLWQRTIKALILYVEKKTLGLYEVGQKSSGLNREDLYTLCALWNRKNSYFV